MLDTLSRRGALVPYCYPESWYLDFFSALVEWLEWVWRRCYACPGQLAIHCASPHCAVLRLVGHLWLPGVSLVDSHSGRRLVRLLQ